jgi:hypothetical protein
MKVRARVLGLVVAGLLVLPTGVAWAHDQQAPLATTSVATKNVPPKQWTRSVCTSLGNWETNIKNLTSDFRTNVATVGSLPEAKDMLVTFLGSAVDETDTLLTQLRKAGVPNLKDGSKVAKLFKNALTDVRGIFADGQQTARTLDTSDPTQFSAAATNLGNDITQGGDKLSQTFKSAARKYKAANKALGAEAACSSIGS